MTIKKSAYIITKPLQYVNTTNIPDENEEKDCFLCNCFDKADEFYSVILKESSHWHKVHLFSNKYTALLFVIAHRAKYNKLYLDSDLGIILTILLFFTKPIDIYTYEEGYASYVYIRDKKNVKDKIAHILNRILNCENYSGGNVMTKGMFLYDIDLFRNNIKPQLNKPIYSFREPFIEHIVNLKEITYMYSLVEERVAQYDKIVLYLSYWEISPKIVNLISKYDDYFKILKLHPNIKGDSSINSYFDFVIPNNYLIEYFIVRKLEEGTEVVVIHHGSFAMHYIKGCEGIKEIII